MLSAARRIHSARPGKETFARQFPRSFAAEKFFLPGADSRAPIPPLRHGEAVTRGTENRGKEDKKFEL